MTKPLVETLPSISAADLRRCGGLKSGKTTAVGWPNGQSAYLIVDDEMLTVSIAMRGRWQTSTIPLERTPQHLGGHRPWFRCPDCGARRAKLYLGADGLMRCRVCLGALHVTTRYRATDRAALAALRLRRRLGWADDATTIGPKPPHMHHRTFERLVDRHEHLMDTAVLGRSPW